MTPSLASYSPSSKEHIQPLTKYSAMRILDCGGDIQLRPGIILGVHVVVADEHIFSVSPIDKLMMLVV